MWKDNSSPEEDRHVGYACRIVFSLMWPLSISFIGKNAGSKSRESVTRQEYLVLSIPNAPNQFLKHTKKYKRKSKQNKAAKVSDKKVF